MSRNTIYPYIATTAQHDKGLYCVLEYNTSAVYAMEAVSSRN